MRSASADDCRDGRYRPAGLLLQWHITERCNLRCAHCYQERDPAEELSYAGLLDVLGQYQALLDLWRNGPDGRLVRGHITVTGGEPFLRTDFFDLMETIAANKRSFSFAILTNGTLIDASTARRVRRLRPAFVQVSLDGTRPTHDAVRGVGAFDRAVEGIRQLTRQRIPTFVSFSAHRGNFREFPEVCRIARELRVRRVWADRIIPCGTGAALRDQVLTPEETRELFHRMKQARRENARCGRASMQVAMHRALQFLVAGGRPYHCTAGDSLVTVMPNGDVYPCRRMPIRVGSLTETPLSRLYYESDLLVALRDRQRLPAGCGHCHFAQFCRGGLKCLSFAVHGDPFTADPGCWYARPQPTGHSHEKAFRHPIGVSATFVLRPRGRGGGSGWSFPLINQPVKGENAMHPLDQQESVPISLDQRCDAGNERESDAPDPNIVFWEVRCDAEKERESDDCTFFGVLLLVLYHGGYFCFWLGGAILLDCWGCTHRINPERRSTHTGLSLLAIGIGAYLVLWGVFWVCSRYTKASGAERQRATAELHETPDITLGSCRGFDHGSDVGTGDDFGDCADAGGDFGDAGGDFGGADFGG